MHDDACICYVCNRDDSHATVCVDCLHSAKKSESDFWKNENRRNASLYFWIGAASGGLFTILGLVAAFMYAEIAP